MDASEKTVLIIGAKGMLGRELADTFGAKKKSAAYGLVLWDMDEINIADETDVHGKIGELRPSVIINAAAYTDVDGCETNREKAFAVNGLAVGYLAQSARQVGAVLMHYSTDYVFDGKKAEGYFETDLPQGPINVYGESKLLGEKLLLEEGERGLRYYLIRTSWLFGRHGKNFVRTMIELGLSGKKELKVVNDQHGKPTYAQDLALFTRDLSDKNAPSGIYHATNEPDTTWYSFAKEIFTIYSGLHTGFFAPEIIPCDSTEFARPAQRPGYSILLNTKMPRLGAWKDSLRRYIELL